MDREGYSLPIPIRSMNHMCETADGQPLTTYFVRPEDWIEYLMNEEPKLLGGWNGNPLQNFESFWRNFQIQKPTHEVFSHHQDRLTHVIPLMIHGDEGRAVKRTNFMVMPLESPIGSLKDPTLTCTCHDQLEKRLGIPQYGSDMGGVESEYLDTCRKQMTNFKGHSYLSHFLLFGVGGWIYKRHPSVINDLTQEVAEGLHKLFHDGVPTSHGRIFGALVAIKGDLDFHKKIMGLTRSYSNAGTASALELCHLCKAGGPNVPFEDYSDNPAWLPTVAIERPWPVDKPPILSQLPSEPCPEQLLEPDMFHVLRLGVARDIVGGVLILLLRLRFFDYEGSTANIVDRLVRAHSHFTLWCAVQRKSPGLRSFTKAFFNLKALTSAPWASSKGSDTILLLQWLLYQVGLFQGNPPVPGHDQLLARMRQVIDACLSVGLVHRHGLWLERTCAKNLYVHLMTVLRGYAVLGRESIRLRVRGFVQKPKHHALHHIAFRLKQELEKGASVILSPQAHGCDCNEDFIGRISRLSRRVGFRLVHLRVINRYFIKIRCLLNKRKARKNPQVWSRK